MEISTQQDLFSAKSTLEQIAKTIAQSFNDLDNLTLYQHYCEIYPLKIIEKAFKQTQITPADKVKKNRAAIFFFFVSTYAKYNKNYSRH
jgi:hypothetical protein